MRDHEIVRPISDASPSPSPRRPERVSLVVQADDPKDLAEVTRDLLEQDPNNRVKADLPLIGAVAVELCPDSVGSLAQAPVRVFPDVPVNLIEPVEEQVGPLLDSAAPTLRADELWQRGLDGKGVTVAVIDTGIAPHPDLKDRIIGFHDVVNGRTAAYDDQGHGTHVAGITAGDGKASGGTYKGIAPGASLVGIKVLNSRGSGSLSDIVRGIQWAVENRERLNIGVINMSLGGRASQSYKNDPMAQAVEKATEAGIVCVLAAGNSGPGSRTVGTPAIAPSAVTVGAADDRATADRSDDILASFSSRGPTPVDGLTKPDVSAPGVRITAADHRSDGYRSLSGTSMATPATAGVTALLLQAHPGATPAQVKEALMETAEPMAGQGGQNAQGRGLVDAVKAEERLGQGTRGR